MASGTTNVAFKPMCTNCGHVFKSLSFKRKEILYHDNSPCEDLRLCFNPRCCPNCGAAISFMFSPTQSYNDEFEYDEKSFDHAISDFIRNSETSKNHTIDTSF